SMEWLKSCSLEVYEDSLAVYFKDKNQYRVMELTRKLMDCMTDCFLADRCISAVDEYKALEFFENKIYENLE
ncbi:MAG: hypothetical protein K2G19_02915, partial [Lachnospiraceae bacterium]|nr:hypothetical protein [Lachnospiraceae bacterium]